MAPKSMIYCKSPNFGFCRSKYLEREGKNKKYVSDDFLETISTACSAGQTLVAAPASAITKRNITPAFWNFRENPWISMDLPHTTYNRITMGFSRKFQNAGGTFLLVIALAGAAARV